MSNQLARDVNRADPAWGPIASNTSDGLMAAADKAQMVGVLPSGTSDDAPRLSAILLAAAAIGMRVYMAGGAWTVNTPIAVPSNTYLDISANAVIQSTMANTGPGGFANSIFFATATAVGVTLALSVDAVYGSNQIVTATNPAAAGIAKGSSILLGYATGGNQAQTATVTNITGAGPYTLTIDEEILFSYWTVANTARIAVYTPPKNIHINGNHCRVFGTGDRVVELAFARYCLVENVVVDQTLGGGVDGFLNIQFSFDIGSRDCTFYRCRADGGSGTLSGVLGTMGFAMEGGNRVSIRDCEAQNFGTSNASGFGVLDSLNGTLDNCTARNCFQGIYIGANDSNGTDGSRGINVIAPTTLNCSSNAIRHDKTSTATITGWYDWGSVQSFAMPVGGAAVIQGFYWRSKTTGTYNGFTGIGGDLSLWGGTIDLTRTDASTHSVGDVGSGLTGTIRLDNARTIAGQFGLFLEDASAHRIILGRGVDFSSATTPFRLGSTSKLNCGQVAMTGSNVTVTKVVCTAKDTIVFTQLTGAVSTVPTMVSIGADTFTALGPNTTTWAWNVMPSIV